VLTDAVHVTVDVTDTVHVTVDVTDTVHVTVDVEEGSHGTGPPDTPALQLRKCTKQRGGFNRFAHTAGPGQASWYHPSAQAWRYA
jgi:hypothetical protein